MNKDIWNMTTSELKEHTKEIAVEEARSKIGPIIAKQSDLKQELKDLSSRQSELGTSTYEEAIEHSVLGTQIKDIRSELMKNRLGENGLRCLNRELEGTRRRY